MDEEKPWRDPEILRDLYWSKGHSTHEIGEVLGVDQRTVFTWMDRHDIPRRGREEAMARALRKKPVSFSTDMYGYESWNTKVGDTGRKVRVHRLLAVAIYGFENVTPDVDVHHRNGIPWDNRPENISLVEHAEHISLHRGEVA